MTTIWLGIETDERGRICTAVLTGDSPWTNNGRTARYRDLHEFQEAWKEEFDGWSFDVSIALDYFEYVRKPSAVADWFTERKDAVLDYFNYESLYPYFEHEVLRQAIPDTFHKAYTLALCAYYRGRSLRVAKGLLLEVYALQNRLQGLEEGLNRLAHTIPPPRNDPTGVFCPF